MPTSPELRKQISDRAERRRRELIEALGGGLLSTNEQYEQVSYWNETNNHTSQRGKYTCGKENISPNQRTTYLLYPARPARSVYNSPLIKASRQPLWESPPPYSETPPCTDQPVSTREFELRSRSFQESLQNFEKKSPSVRVQLQNVDESRGVGTRRTPLFGHRMYPSLPRSDSNEGVKSIVKEKDLKEDFNRSTANASQRGCNSTTTQTLSYFSGRSGLSNCRAEKGNLDESPPHICNSFKINAKTLAFVDDDSPSEPAKDQTTLNSTSDNDIEDTYDMDMFLEEALGSALNLNLTMSDGKDTDSLREDSFSSLEYCKTTDKIHTTSTLRSSMRLLKSISTSDLQTDRIGYLLTEAGKQQQVIAQASKAINICRSSKQFSSSLSLVEAERLLLLATLRHKNALNEVRGLMPSPSESHEEFTGRLRVLEVSAPLTDSRSLTLGKSARCDDLWFVCVLNCGQQVIVSDAVVIQLGTKRVTFSSVLELTNLPSSFDASLQIYTLRINKLQESVHKSKMGKACKLLRRQSKSCLSPATSSEMLHLRTPAFALSGTVSIDVSHAGNSGKQNLCLETVPLMSPLDGSVRVHIETSVISRVQFSGFLTILQKSGDSYAWQRRWCRLNESEMQFWNYPSDEDDKEPLDVIDLKFCFSDKIKQAPRHLCARSRTLMLETKRVSSPKDMNSTMMECNADYTLIRYFLSCDSVGDMNEWASVLTKAVHSMKLWNIK